MIRSVYTDGLFSLVYTDRITDIYFLSVNSDKIRDESISVGKNYRRKNSVGFHRFYGSVMGNGTQVDVLGFGTYRLRMCTKCDLLFI